MNWFFTALNIIIIGMLGYIVYQQNLELTYYDSMNEAPPIVSAESKSADLAETASAKDSEKSSATTEEKSEAPKEKVKTDDAQPEAEEVATPAVTEEPVADDEVIRPNDNE